jgi:hypothetical protein
MSIKIRPRLARKLLVASVGVAAVSYVGVGCDHTSVANLAPPPSCSVQPDNPYCYGPKPDAGPDGGDEAGRDGAGDASEG